MSAQSCAELLASICTREELCEVTYLLSDETTVRAMAERDNATLSRLFGVGYTPYENILREYEGIEFRNRPNKFEITKHGNVILSAPDDLMGTVGCSVVSRVIEASKTTLRSSYLGNSRYIADPATAVASIKQGSLRRAIPSLRQQFPQVSRALNAIEKMDHVDPDDDDIGGRTRMAEYLDQVMTLFTWLRGRETPPRYEDPGRPLKALSIVDFVCGGSTDPLVDGVVPADGKAFSGDEQSFVRLLIQAKRLVSASDNDGEYLVLPSRDVFELIGDQFRAPPTIPNLYGTMEQAPLIAVSPVAHKSPQPGPSTAATAEFSKALELYREYCLVDANKYPELKTAVRTGGFSSQAKMLYAELPKARKAKLFEGICEEGPMAFSEAVKVIADRLGVEGDDVCAEMVAVRLVAAKSCFKLDRNNVLSRR